MHEWCPQHFHVGTARMKQDKATEEEGKQNIVNKKELVGTKYG